MKNYLKCLAVFTIIIIQVYFLVDLIYKNKTLMNIKYKLRDSLNQCTYQERLCKSMFRRL